MSKSSSHGQPEPDSEPLSASSGEGYVSEFISETVLPPRKAPTPFKPVGTPSVAPIPHLSKRRSGVPWLWLLLLAAVLGGAAAYVRFGLVPSNASIAAEAPATAEGTATIISRPAGAQVFIDGTLKGTSPLKLSLPVGSYTLELQNGGAKRSLMLSIEADSSVREFVDLAPVVAGMGRLEISTDVPGQRVTVDGAPRGVTPLTIPEIQAGSHRIAIGSGSSTMYRTVTVAEGATASVVASVVPAGASGGWLSINAPFDMQVRQDGSVLGTTGAERLMLPAGTYELELVAPQYEFETTVSARVEVGRTVTVPVSVPNGILSINALPWAEVWVDNRPLGTTPIGNVSVPVGDREVVWRHPQLGERRQTVRIPAKSPVRVGVDLSRR